jgi:predicted type IV restriction endonuclease
MSSLSAKVLDRIRDALKKFQPILSSAKARDVNESDTVIIVTDLLECLFGYDKYSEITSEHVIRGTYCDLAVKIDGKLVFLLEAKAIGLELKEQHVKQAVDYAANQGVEWVILTSGAVWRIYKVGFGKPITYDMVVEFDLLAMNARSAETIDVVGLLAKEGWQKERIEEYYSYKEALNRFTLGALLLSEPVLSIVRRELRRMTPGLKVDVEEIEKVLRNEVFKREVLDCEKATTAKKQVARAANKFLRQREEKEEDSRVESGALRVANG